jgi:arginine decarboxylase
LLQAEIKGKFKIEFVSSEEEPKFEFYTSRLGGYKNIVSFTKTNSR